MNTGPDSGSGQPMGTGASAPPLRSFTHAEGAQLLMSPLALPDLARDAALKVAHHMRLRLASAGSVLFRAGQPGSPFMSLVMDGDAAVEGRLSATSPPVVLRALGPGCLYGEMGAPDSLERLITVRAGSQVCVAVLTYDALESLVADDAQLGLVLTRSILAHVVRRLRQADTWIETLNQINRSLQEEWNAELKLNRDIAARLDLLIRLERGAGVKSRLVGHSLQPQPAP